MKNTFCNLLYNYDNQSVLDYQLISAEGVFLIYRGGGLYGNDNDTENYGSARRPQ